MEKQKWWGYLHTNGSIQVKRYWDIRDIQDADQSPFVLETTNPFLAESREDALAKAERLLK